LSPDGDATMLMVQADTEAVEAITAVAMPDGAEVLYSGNPVVFASVLDQLSWFLLIIPPIIIVLLVGVFYLTIGDRRLSAMSLIPAGLGALWTFGLLSVSGREIDVVTVVVPIFIIVMGSADGLHFVTHFQDESRQTDPVARVASALRHVGVPMILTTVSTAAGFLSLVVTDVRPIQQLGAFTAIGIVFAGIISFFSLPAAISRLHIGPPKRTPVIGPRAVGLLKRGVRTRVPAMVLVGVLVAFAAIAIPQLEVDSDQLFFFKDGDPVRVAFETTEDLFGGASPLMGEFVFDPAAGPGQLERLAEVTKEMEALPGVRSVVSVVGFAGVLGPEQVEAVLAGEVDLPFGTMVSDDGLRFTLLPEAFTTAELQGWLDYVDETPEVRTLTGLPIIWDEIARLVLDAQRTSIVVAFGLVAAMLLVAYRRVRETLASLVPIGLTVATLLGFLAVSGIQLNLLTAVASGIVIGVGIDYAIHFVAAIDVARPGGPGYVQRALDRAGPPIVANALGIAVGMTGLWLSPLAVHPQISLIMWVSMLTAAATALLVIPAFLPREATADVPPVELVTAGD
jgi:predicted RND superfamily exporter protein